MSKLNRATLVCVANAESEKQKLAFRAIVADNLKDLSALVKGAVASEAIKQITAENPNFDALKDFASRRDGVGTGVRSYLKSCGFEFAKDKITIVSFSTQCTTKTALEGFFSGQELNIESAKANPSAKPKKEVKKSKDSALFLEGSVWNADMARFLKAQEKKMSRKAHKCLVAILENFNEKAVADFGKKA